MFPWEMPRAKQLFALSMEPVHFPRTAPFCTEKVNHQTTECQLAYGEVLLDALPVLLDRVGFQPVAEICKYQTAE